jgi:formylglycine-generating enzyme required for sulfatase activity
VQDKVRFEFEIKLIKMKGFVYFINGRLNALRFTGLLVVIFSTFHQGTAIAQQNQTVQRGMKPVQVTIDGSTTTLYKQSHALLIGASAYNYGLPALPGVVGDINTVKAILEKMGFSTTVVMNPTSLELQRAFSNFIARYGQGIDNRLVFYYAGHGYTQKMPYGDDIGYICPIDAPDPNKDLVSFETKAMPMRTIETYAYQIKSKHALFLFDACFSGSIFSTSRAIPEVINYKTKEPVRQFITSGSANETVPDKSIFRSQFERGLKGEADLNRDGFITGSELGDFLQTTVVNYTSNYQHPQYGKIRNPNLDKGDFVFVLGVPSNSASGNYVGAVKTEPPVETISEKSLVRYGNLEITTELSGKLYIDNVYKKEVAANTLLTINNLSEGTHSVRIEGDETVEKSVTISTEMKASITIDKTRKLLGGLPEMVFVKGGSFQMGSGNGGSDEKPVHPVTLSDFYIGKYEVTQKQWSDVMGSNPSVFRDCDNCPIENVSWYDIQEFLQKLNAKTGKNYRLPTEAEWEFAARGGIQNRGYTYSGSNSIGDVAWYNSNASSKTHPVGQKQPNELGIFDMSGNVWEWCSDWYDEKYYNTSPTFNPKGPSGGNYHSLRGGCWGLPVDYCRTAFRLWIHPDGRNDLFGFRLCRTD